MQSEVPDGAMGSAEGTIAPSTPAWLRACSPVILKRVSNVHGLQRGASDSERRASYLQWGRQ